MNDHDQIEQQIRHVLATVAHAIPLSEQLFSPEGLFALLAADEAERRVVAQSSLFKEAQARFRQLQLQEAAEFSQRIGPIQYTPGSPPLVYKVERMPKAS